MLSALIIHLDFPSCSWKTPPWVDNGAQFLLRLKNIWWQQDGSIRHYRQRSRKENYEFNFHSAAKLNSLLNPNNGHVEKRYAMCNCALIPNKSDLSSKWAYRRTLSRIQPANTSFYYSLNPKRQHLKINRTHNLGVSNLLPPTKFLKLFTL